MRPRLLVAGAALVAGTASAEWPAAAPVVSVEGRWFLLLGPAPAAELWGPKADTLVEANSALAYAVPFANAWGEQPPWTGAVTLYGPAGKVCQATPGPALVLIRTEQDFGEEPRTAEARQASIDAAKARPGDASLALPLTAAGSCDGALFAAPPEARPAIYKVSPADKGLRERALAAFRALPAYADHAKAYAEWRATQPPEAKTPTHWEDAGSGLLINTLDGNGKRFVVLSVVDDQGCGDFFRGNATVVFALEGKALSLLSNPKRPPTGTSFHAAADLDDDGLPELFTPTGVLPVTNAPAQPEWRTAPPSYLCPC